MRARRHRYPLSKAHDCGQIIRVRCTWCGINRYLPSDLMKLFGDISWWDIGRFMRCAECGKKEYFDVKDPACAFASLRPELTSIAP